MLSCRLLSLAKKGKKLGFVQTRGTKSKIWSDVDAAVADVKDGQTLYVVWLGVRNIRSEKLPSELVEIRKSAISIRHRDVALLRLCSVWLALMVAIAIADK